MLGWVVRSSLQFVYLVLAIAAASGVYASYALTQLPFDVLPKFNPPIVEIQTEARGLSAASVDELRRGGETFDLQLVIPAFYLSFGKNSIEGQKL
jgi:hypothetical protein